MSSSIDIETKKTLQPETGSLVEVEQQKTERNNQTEMKYETKVADCNAQGDTKNVCRIHDTALDLFVSTFLLVCYVPNHQFWPCLDLYP